MATFVTETPSGTINGVNTSFTTTQSVDSLISVVLDGLPYFGGSATGTALTLTDAPTSNLTVTYLASSSVAIAGDITALSAETEWLRHKNLATLLTVNISDTLFWDWLNKINHYFYRRIIEINPEDYIQETTINLVPGTTSYALPSTFKTISQYGCGIFLVNDEGTQTDRQLNQMRFGDNTMGYRINGTTLNLTQDPNTSQTYTVRYLATIAEIDEDSDTLLIPEEYKDYLMNAIDMFYEIWTNDPNAEALSDQRFVRAMDELLRTVNKVPQVLQSNANYVFF